MPANKTIPNGSQSQPDNVRTVYVIGYNEIPGQYKIGSASSLEDRLATLQTASPYQIVLIHSIHSKNAFALEKRLHKRFANQRIRLEWFQLSEDDLSYIKSLSGVVRSVPKRLHIEQSTGNYKQNPIAEIVGEAFVRVLEWDSNPGKAIQAAYECYIEYGLTGEQAGKTMVAMLTNEVIIP